MSRDAAGMRPQSVNFIGVPTVGWLVQVTFRHAVP
jgi:hypothetical protein